MAYAAATSLKNTIVRLLYYPDISLVPPSRKIIKFAYTQAQSLQVLLDELDRTSKGRSRKRVNALDDEIREAVSIFEDVLESHVSDQFLSQSDQERTGDGIRFSIDLLDLKQDIHSFTRRVRKLKRAYRRALRNMLPDEDAAAAAVSSATDFDGKKSDMVGLSDEFQKMKVWATGAFAPHFKLILLLGMAGIGKTTLAKKIFGDPHILSHFRCHAWVTVGRQRQLKEILRVIIAQVNPDSDQMLAGGDEDIAQCFKESLKGRRFLIMLDDVWDKGLWRDLESLIRDDNNGSRVLITTRLQEVAMSSFTLKMRLLNEEESWDLLREKVFAKELCPPQLEKVGKKIAEHCEGLPLTIIAIAELLSEAEMTLEYWNKVAEKQNSVFMDAYNEISKVLYPSYDYLPQHLKMCFICMGVFPENYVIPRSKLVNMWIVEEFLETKIVQFSEDYAIDCLRKLVYNSLVMVYQTSSTVGPSIKSCRIHSSLLHLCKREAAKNKSFHVLNSLKDGLAEGMKSQRRLCIHNNILLGIKDVYNSFEDDCACTARFLGCFGLYHPYQVPMTFGLRLLRLLDALTIRFYEFPLEVLKLVQLRYLSLTYNGKLPSSISKLWNLQFLIIRPHLTIKSNAAPSYLPMEIWGMKELKHLHITGSDLPDPSCDTFLPKLSTLLDVSDRICTKGVLKRIPDLKKLGLRIELRPDADQPLSCFAHISYLNKLESLKCVIVNPEHRFKIVASPTPLSKFPLGLIKLSLSGLGYPWEEMTKIASLPNLQVLKLRNYAFRGPKWEIEENEFKELRSLVIEDTDLVQWKVGCESFGIYLSCLSFKNCYKLEEIHWERFILPLDIQIVDCNPLAVTCVKQIKLRTRSSHVRVAAHSSWDDGKLNNQVQKVSIYSGLL